MPIGNQPTSAMQFNLQAATVAVQLRSVCEAIINMQSWAAKKGVSGLQDIGYTGPDAQAMLNAISYMNTIALVFYGKLQQGGTGGSGASTFNFSDALSDLTGPT